MIGQAIKGIIVIAAVAAIFTSGSDGGERRVAQSEPYCSQNAGRDAAQAADAAKLLIVSVEGSIIEETWHVTSRWMHGCRFAVGGEFRRGDDSFRSFLVFMTWERGLWRSDSLDIS